jgi:hypothetical protein
VIRAQKKSRPEYLPGRLSPLVTEDMISAPCGPDPSDHVRGITAYTTLGSTRCTSSR